MPRIQPDDPFVGHWRFDETGAQYQLGTPPRDAAYEITTDGEHYNLTMRWKSTEGHSIEQAYNAIPDGQHYSFDDSPGVDSFSMERIDAFTLDTTARRAGAVVSHARRVLSDDHNTMTITTDVHTPGGTHYTNIAVYRRVRD